jgi:hypothetical protein
VLVVTDERVLLFAIGAGSGMPVMVESHPLPAVQLVDATMQGPTSSVVLRFPDAVVGWFHPVPAWRSETEAVLGALAGAATGPRPPQGPTVESGRADGPYPADPTREQIRRSH